MRLAVFLFVLFFASPAFADLDSMVDSVDKGISNSWHHTKKGVGHFLGYGDEAKDSFLCSDRGFFVIRQEDEASDAESWVLKGVVHTPGAGFQYHFVFLGVQGPRAFAALQVGQPVQAYAQQRSYAGEMQVMQKFAMAPGVGLLQVRVEGLGGAPREFTCDLTPTTKMQ